MGPPSAESITDRGPSATLREDLRIDGHEADLVNVAGLAEAPDGTLAVGQWEDAQVRLYSAAGVLLGTLGRRGEGPGEFRSIRGVAWRSRDSIAVHDMSLRRLSVLPVDRGQARTAPVGRRPDPSDPQPVIITSAQMRPDGSILGQALVASRSESVTREDRLVLLGPEPGQQRLVARMVSADPKVEVREGSWAGSAVLPAANPPAIRLAQDGSRILIARADLEGDDAGTFVLTALGAEGDTLLSRRYAFEPIEVTPEYADSVIEARAQDMASPLARAYQREAQMPPLLKPIIDVIDGVDGTIWVRLRRSSGEHVYTVLDGRGEVVGQVPIPRRMGLLLARRTHVWLLERDEWGVASLSRHRLDWGS